MQVHSLRVSVLEHCQLRCAYCLPEAYLGFAKKEWMSLEHYEKVARVLARFSIKKARFTGGEPLLRKELPQIIEKFSHAMPKARLALTTNGQRFSFMAEALLNAGLQTITLHVDSLKEQSYVQLMGKGELKIALKSLELAQNLGFSVKINVVVQRDLNDNELVDFLVFSKQHGVQVRFIELMDTGSARDFVAKHFISGREIREKLSPLDIKAEGRLELSDPAKLFYASKLGVTFGLIASDTEPFCDACDRLRLSADGRIYTCLYDPNGSALSLDKEEETIFLEASQKIKNKESLHPSQKKTRRLFSMSELGG